MPNRYRNTMTTVTLSPALKRELETIRDTVGHKSLNETIMAILQNPRDGNRPLSGREDLLTEPVKTTELTRDSLRRIRDNEGFRDYEAVIRAKAGIAERDVGEEPIDLEPLAG